MSIVAPGSARVAATLFAGLLTGLVAGLVAATPTLAEPLSLAECTRLALTHNLEAEQARGDLKAADADVVGARSVFLPQVSASGSWTKPEENIEVFQAGQLRFFDQTWSARVGGSLTLFDGFANWYGYRQASGARTAARGLYKKARQDVVYETERRFFEVRRQEALLQVQQQAVELSGEQLKKTTAMKDLGAATQADVFKAEVERSNSQLAELRTVRDFEIAKASLGSYLGRDPRESLELAPEEPTLDEEPELSTAIDRALETNPSLAAARAGFSASRSGVRAAKANRLPSLSLFGSTDYFNFELKDWDDEHVEWRYGLSVDFTVFDGFLTKSRIHRAEASLLKSRRAAESAERDVVLAVRTASLDLEIARRQIDVAEEAVRSSEEDHRLATERYRLGEGTILDVIDAQVNLTRLRSALQNARFDARLALSALKSAIGDLPVPEPAE